jgi:pyridoxine kinase
MARVLCISSQTVFGPVGNSAAVPALQELGHEVLALPTVLLSNHPGHGKPAGQVTDIAAMFEALNRVGALAGLDAVLTGYFSSDSQVIAVTKQIAALVKVNQALQVLVDPVIGDNGALYVPEAVASAIRDHLLPLATITTPNVFELRWLTGREDINTAVTALGANETLVTSLASGDRLISRLYSGGDQFEHVMVRLPDVPHGTGDFLAGCYLGERLLKSPAPAFDSAMERLHQAVELSAGRSALWVSPRPSA